MKIGIILTRPSPNFVAATELLSARGITTELVFANRGAFDLATLSPNADLYIVKSGRAPALALAGALHDAGAATHWPYPLAARHKNKLLVAATLARADIPVPETIMAADLDAVAALVADGPVMLKPCLGSRGEGIQLVRDRRELASVPPPASDEPIMAQRYLAPDAGGSYLVAYRIGDDVFGLRRQWPLENPHDPGALFELPDDMRALALRCGDAFDVDLYSVDFVVSGGTAHVVDMSLHAGFVGVPDAPERVARYLEGQL